MRLDNVEKLKLALLLLLWVGVFVPIVPELVQDWGSHSDNSHGFIVPLISAYFIWQRRELFLEAHIKPDLLGGLFFVFTLVVYLMSYAGAIAVTARVAMVLSLLGLCWYCLGRDVMRILLFPILFLLFMVPIPSSLIGLVSVPLQLLATKISAQLIALSSIPVYREGNMLYFVGTQLEVAEACSGIRSIMSLSMIAVAIAFVLQCNNNKKAIFLVLSAIPIAMIANILRITGTGLLAHVYGDNAARGFLHEFSGIVIFIFGFSALLLVSRIICGRSSK